MSLGRVGVFGSLCNPPHLGHLILAAEAAWQLRLERVVVVPTGTPPHRATPREGADARARLAAALVSCDPILALSRVEVEREGPSYMVDTLRELAQRYPGQQLVLLLGTDQLAALSRWHDGHLIPELARIAVAPRAGIAVKGLEHAAVERIEMPAIGISSSEIRRRVAAGSPIRHLVPEPVRAMIEAERLYEAPLRADRRAASMLDRRADFGGHAPS